MTKTAKKNTTTKKKTTKKPTWYEKWKFVNTWQRKKPTEVFIERLIEEMFTHFENPKHISVTKFLSERGIIFDVFNDWTHKYENLKEAYTIIMQHIGSYREELAMRKEHNCNPQTLHYTMRHYSPMWRKSFTEESDLKLKAAEKGSNDTKVVVIEKFPDESEE